MKHLLLLALLFIRPLVAQLSIAVIDFDGKNVTLEDASALTDRLRIELFNTRKFVVTEREKMDAILEEQGFQLSECSSDECIVEMGQLIGVQQIVAGSVMRIGRVYSVAARIIDVERGSIINTAIFDHEGEIGNLLKVGMREIARQLAGQPGMPASMNEYTAMVSVDGPINEEILLAVLRNHMGAGYFVYPNIPDKKLSNALKTCEVPEEEKILAIIDATVMGNAKHCLAIGQGGIYVHNDWSGKTPGRHYYSYKDFLTLNIERSGAYEVMLGNVGFNTAGASMKKDAIVSLLQDLQRKLRGNDRN